MDKNYCFSKKLVLVIFIGFLFISSNVTLLYANSINEQDLYPVYLEKQGITGRATSIKLSRTSATLYYGRNKYYSLKATVVGSNKSVRWKSSNVKVATVSTAGKVTVKKAGTVIISATVSGKTAKCKFTIKSRKASNLIYKKFLSQNKAYTKFQVLDVDGNGVEELLVSKSGYGYEIYTIKNKKIVKCGTIGDLYFWRDFKVNYSSTYKTLKGYTGGTGVEVHTLYSIGGNNKLKEKYYASISSRGTLSSKVYYQILVKGKRKHVSKSEFYKYEEKYFGKLKTISLIGTSKSNIGRILY